MRVQVGLLQGKKQQLTHCKKTPKQQQKQKKVSCILYQLPLFCCSVYLLDIYNNVFAYSIYMNAYIGHLQRKELFSLY